MLVNLKTPPFIPRMRFFLWIVEKSHYHTLVLSEQNGFDHFGLNVELFSVQQNTPDKFKGEKKDHECGCNNQTVFPVELFLKFGFHKYV